MKFFVEKHFILASFKFWNQVFLLAHNEIAIG
jgi:hypothetical protein